MKIEKVSLIGMGAIGAVYAQNLNKNMPQGDFLVVADSQRKQKLDCGVIINNEKNFFNVCVPEQKVEPSDLVIITTKYAQLDQAIIDIRNHVGNHTIILSLLNGISSEERIAKQYGFEKIVFGKSFGLGSTRAKDDSITYTTMGFIPIGEKKGETRKERLEAIQELFEKCEIGCKISKDIEKDMWYKFMVNIGSNQVSAVTGANYGDFNEISEVMEMTVDVMQEVIAVAKKLDIDLSEKDIELWQTAAKKYSGEGKTSTLQDIQAKRKTEVDFFAGALIELGKKYNVPTPLNKFLLQQIHALEKINKTS